MKAKSTASRARRKPARPAAREQRAGRRKVTTSPRSKPARTRQRALVGGGRTSVRKKSVARETRRSIPPILLEGDRPAPPPLSGPGQKFALGEHPKVGAAATAELPEAYGTGRLFVTSRDPHWLYAHWDLTREQQRRCNAQSLHGHLVLRTYCGAVAGKPVSETHVHPESRHWFVHVENAATGYAAELGYVGRDHKWKRVAASAGVATPPNAVSQDTSTAFATIPMDTPFAELQAKVRQELGEDLPLAQAWEELRQRSQLAKTAAAVTEAVPPRTPKRERALAEAIRADISPCAWMDSLAIAELIQGRPGEEISSPGEAAFSLAVGPASIEEAVSSPAEGYGPGGKGFWFNVNAELVIYGATEPGATVTIGGELVPLRPDGSFSFRFALPDGQYALTLTALSADGTDWRAAELRFSRVTESAGEVGTHPPEAGLLPPAPQDV